MRLVAACGVLDPHILTEIEEAGAEELASAESLHRAPLIQLEARALCKLNPTAAIDLYERIAVTRIHPVLRASPVAC